MPRREQVNDDRRRVPGRRRGVLAASVAVSLALTVTGCSTEDSEPSVATASSTTSAPTTTTTPALEAPDHPWVVAHRGSSAAAPELTFAAFDLAVEQGADHLELDLHLTADGELAVLHDPLLNRTMRGPAETCTGLVDERTVAELQGCDAGTWFNETYPDRADLAFAEERLPTFAAMLARYGTEVRYYVETKKLLAGEGMEEKLIADLEAAGFTADSATSQQIVVQSFDAESAQRVHRLRPDLSVTKLINAGEGPDADALAAIATYASGISPNVIDVNEASIVSAHEQCLTVIPYTVDDPAEMTRLLDLGVDGIISNRPDVLRPLATARSHTPPCP